MLSRWNLLMLSALCLGCVADPKPKQVDEDPEPHASPIEEVSADEAAADEVFLVKFETSQGDFVMEVHPSWSPIGAAHFKELVEDKFYDNCRFFRVLDGFMAQFGINGDPEMTKKWGKEIRDDKVRKSNSRGMVTYAKTGMPDSRSTQLFINFGDNSQLDGQGFSPFARVIKGMSVVDQLYNGYGEGAPSGSGPDQGQIESKGNEYLIKNFPKLDYIKTARIVASVEEEGAATPPAEGQPAETTPAQ